MGLIRIITIGAILYLIYRLTKHFTGQGKWPVKRTSKQGKTQAQRENHSKDEVMVACKYCDIRIPKTQAISHHNDWFCGQAHLQAYEHEKNQ